MRVSTRQACMPLGSSCVARIARCRWAISWRPNAARCISANTSDSRRLAGSRCLVRIQRQLQSHLRIAAWRYHRESMSADPETGRDRINSYALVSYIPDPMAGFLDRLRQELVPNCFLRAHATILPPRPICSKPREAWDRLCFEATRFEPFDVELTGVEVFPVSDVIH